MAEIGDTLYAIRNSARFVYIHRVRKKGSRSIRTHNFDKFRHSFVIFGVNHPDTSMY